MNAQPTAKIILNPYAGRWKAKAAIPAVVEACEQIGLRYDLALTEEPKHGIAVAQAAIEAGHSPIIAAGGDGTINEVLNGIMRAAAGRPPVPMGIIPLGSADDLAYGLSLPQEIQAACSVILVGHTRTIDVGCVNGRYFGNNSAIGLEPSVTVIQEGIRHIRGTPRYLLSALLGVLRFKPWHVRMEWDGGTYEGTLTLASVGNTRRTGGAFFMTPRAQTDDGLLDLVHAEALGRLRLLRLLPMTFDGSHVEQPDVHYGQITHLTIDCDPPTPIQADGELFDRAATHIEYTVLPGSLQAIVPAS